MPEFVTIPDVELARVGTWATSTGPWHVTATSITDAVRASTDGAFRAPVIKVGHTDPRFDGQPSVGTIRNLRASDDGQALVGDLVGVPSWLAEQMPHTFPSRSVEGLQNVVTASGARYSFLLTGLALLGVTAPAIQSLADLQGLYEAVAANGQAFTYESPVIGVPMTVAASDNQIPSDATAPEVPAAPEGASTEREGSMPDTTLRDLLRPHVGFAEDADDKAIADAVALALAEQAEVRTVEVVPEPVAAAAQRAGLLEAEVKNLGEQLGKVSGELQDVRAAEAIRTKKTFFDVDAIGSGRISPAEREHYESLWDIDSDKTSQLILARAAHSAVPVDEVGHGTDTAATDDGWFPQFATTAQEG